MYQGGPYGPPTKFFWGKNCMVFDEYSWRPNSRGLLQKISNKNIKIWGNGSRLKKCNFYGKNVMKFFENFNGPRKNHHKMAQNHARDLFEVSIES